MERPGVITGLAVLKFLKEQGVRPQYTLEVVGLVEEEGSRFAASCQGSCAICGTLGEQELMEKDVDGITFLDAAHAAGYAPDRWSRPSGMISGLIWSSILSRGLCWSRAEIPLV